MTKSEVTFAEVNTYRYLRTGLNENLRAGGKERKYLHFTPKNVFKGQFCQF